MQSLTQNGLKGGRFGPALLMYTSCVTLAWGSLLSLITLLWLLLVSVPGVLSTSSTASATECPYLNAGVCSPDSLKSGPL